MHTEIEIASKRIAGYIRTTPVMYLEPDAWGIEAHIALKLEQLQHTGSFKPRGAGSTPLRLMLRSYTSGH